jgi:hypothetical protein
VALGERWGSPGGLEGVLVGWGSPGGLEEWSVGMMEDKSVGWGRYRRLAPGVFEVYQGED